MRRLARVPLLPLQLTLLLATGAPEAPVSAPRSLVWGPGLQAAVVLPVRYFYLQAVNSDGQNLTRSPPGSVRPQASLASLPAPLLTACAARPPPRRPGIHSAPPPSVRRLFLSLVTFPSVFLPDTKEGGRSPKSLSEE